MDPATSDALRTLLLRQGASLVGFADLGRLAPAGMPFGVAMAIALPPAVVASIHEGPNPAYFEAYERLNAQLGALVTTGVAFLAARGYRAEAQPVSSHGDRSDLPHKTVATRAGLGWIGKCALLVTPEFGGAVRLGSLVTDAELACATPVTASRCGDCNACTEACPGAAVSGKRWQAGMARDELLNAAACRQAGRRLSAERLNRVITLCGKCFEVCPHTRRYLRG